LHPDDVSAIVASVRQGARSAASELAGGVAEDVAEAAARDLRVLLDDLRELVSRDSESADRPALDALARVLGDRLATLGFAVELVDSPAGLHVHAWLAGGGRSRVALLCHHDTVFPAGTAAARGFVVDGDLVRGPGVADMKGGIVVAAHAARLLVALHGERAGRVSTLSRANRQARMLSGKLNTAILCVRFCGPSAPRARLLPVPPGLPAREPVRRAPKAEPRRTKRNARRCFGESKPTPPTTPARPLPSTLSAHKRSTVPLPQPILAPEIPPSAPSSVSLAAALQLAALPRTKAVV